LLNVSRPYLVKLVESGALPIERSVPGAGCISKTCWPSGPGWTCNAKLHSRRWPTICRSWASIDACYRPVRRQRTPPPSLTRNLLHDHPALTPERLAHTRRLMDAAVPDAHGAPDSAWTYLLLEGKTWASDALVMERLSDIGQTRVVVVGHSHQEHLRQIGPLTVVNVGAVSRQKDGSPLARLALLEGEGAVWNVSFQRVPYEVDVAALWAETYAYKGAQEAAQLRTGTVSR
jgi:Calcineurin-like phosphoesterase superfamily domain